MFESKLEDIAQLTGVIDYGDAWAIDEKATADKEYRKQVRALIGDWEDAMEEENDEEATKVAEKIKALVPKKEN